MSFSNPGYSPALQDAIDYAWSQGAVVVAATGNDGSSTPTYPGRRREGRRRLGTDAERRAVVRLELRPGHVHRGARRRHHGRHARRRDDVGDRHLGLGRARCRRGRAAEGERSARRRTASSSGGSRGARTRPGRAEQTGNGRLNLERAIADTRTDAVVPAGAPRRAARCRAVRRGRPQRHARRHADHGAQEFDEHVRHDVHEHGGRCGDQRRQHAVPCRSPRAEFHVVRQRLADEQFRTELVDHDCDGDRPSLFKAAAAADAASSGRDPVLSLKRRPAATGCDNTFTATATFNTPTCTLNPTSQQQQHRHDRPDVERIRQHRWGTAGNWTPSGVPRTPIGRDSGRRAELSRCHRQATSIGDGQHRQRREPSRSPAVAFAAATSILNNGTLTRLAAARSTRARPDSPTTTRCPSPGPGSCPATRMSRTRRGNRDRSRARAPRRSAPSRTPAPGPCRPETSL